MKYFNKIKNDITDYPYRFKTKEEFKKEYGDEWIIKIKYGWIDDIYFGEDLELSTNKQHVDELIDNDDVRYNNEYAYKGEYSISRQMITPNDPLFDNKPRQLVYENKILKFNKF